MVLFTDICAVSKEDYDTFISLFTGHDLISWENYRSPLRQLVQNRSVFPIIPKILNVAKIPSLLLQEISTHWFASELSKVDSVLSLYTSLSCIFTSQFYLPH